MGRDGARRREMEDAWGGRDGNGHRLPVSLSIPLSRLDEVVQVCSHSTQETGSGGVPVQGQPVLHGRVVVLFSWGLKLILSGHLQNLHKKLSEENHSRRG